MSAAGQPSNASTPVLRPAPTARPILPLLAGRWSARAIDADRPVTRAQVATLLEAARWAPSHGNAQPWRYLVFDAGVPDALARARGCLRRGNTWAHRAPVLLLSLVECCWPDSDDVNPSAAHDVGAASLALCLQAASEGLIAHQMGGFDRALARERFTIGPRFEPRAFIAVGYPGTIDVLDDRRRARETAPRQRRPVAQTAFVGGLDGVGLSP